MGGGITPLILNTEVSGHLHASAPFTLGKAPHVSVEEKAGRIPEPVWLLCGKEALPRRESSHNPTVLQPITVTTPDTLFLCVCLYTHTLTAFVHFSKMYHHLKQVTTDTAQRLFSYLQSRNT